MAVKSKQDICATCGHARGVHGVGMCIGAAHAAAPGQRVQVGCERNCEACVEKDHAARREL